MSVNLVRTAVHIFVTIPLEGIIADVTLDMNLPLTIGVVMVRINREYDHDRAVSGF